MTAIQPSDYTDFLGTLAAIMNEFDHSISLESFDSNRLILNAFYPSCSDTKLVAIAKKIAQFVIQPLWTESP